VDGRFSPVFVHASGSKWLAPIPIYASALMMKVSGILGGAGEPLLAARKAAALMGCLDVLLIYYIVMRAFRSAALAFAAGLMVLFSPAHALFSRLASEDGIWQLPFIALWVAGLIGFAEASGRLGRRSWLATSVASLAASIYTQPSAGVMIPWFGFATMAAVYRTQHGTWRDVAVAAGAGACVLVPLGLWFARYPSSYIDTLGAWALHPAYIRNPVEWMRAWSNIQTLSVSANVFWDFFSPSHLFFKSSAAGAHPPVLLVVPGLLLVCGLFEVLRIRRARKTGGVGIIYQIGALGFIIGPLGAATFKQRWAIQRTVVLVLFGALLATIGLSALWTRSRVSITAAAEWVRRAVKREQPQLGA
jgi:hypothetical protein